MLVVLSVAELTLVDYFVMGEAVGIVATLFVAFYYSRKQMQKLSVDLETKILNDLDDKLHGIAELAFARPEVGEILDRESANMSTKESAAMYVLYVYAYGFHMRQRGVLRDNEWAGWIGLIRAAFRKGTIGEYWKTIEPENWFDPEFRDFIDNEIIGREKKMVSDRQVNI
ncbi:MAG TPA: hypothetical protein VE692_06955 [Nitrososphaera sp.]|nr:hypothetical protein [Nitrososphaera sp.]